MGRKNKLKKFAEITNFNNVLEAFELEEGELYRNLEEKVYLKGKWSEAHFGNHAPLVLELACGKGEYTNALAKRYPDRNFVGVDIKGNRIWKGAVHAREEGLDNVSFLRTRIEYLDVYFGSGEINAIWITFPDPFLRPSKSNRRLTSPFFLDKYTMITSSGASLYLKTDDTNLYEFSLKSIEDHENYKLEHHTADVYGSAYDDILGIQTYYEKKHLAKGKKIKFIAFSRI